MCFHKENGVARGQGKSAACPQENHADAPTEAGGREEGEETHRHVRNRRIPVPQLHQSLEVRLLLGEIRPDRLGSRLQVENEVPNLLGTQCTEVLGEATGGHVRQRRCLVSKVLISQLSCLRSYL